MDCIFCKYDQNDDMESCNVENELSLEFIIILKDHDFLYNRCGSLYKHIKKATKKMPGKVNICRHDEIKKYKIKGLILPYVLYIKLPKEDTYVSSDAWETEYFNSQTLELLKIFTLLGASDIKFKTTRDHNDINSVGLHAGLNLNSINVPVKVGTDIEHYEDVDDGNAFDGQIKIKQPLTEKYNSLESLIEKNSLYYVKNNYEWQSLISYKIQNDTITKLKFNTTFYKGFKYGTKIAADLEALGISVCLFDSGSKYVKIIFEVYFGDDSIREYKSRDESSRESMSIHI